MNVLSKHQLGIKYQNYMFVNTMISNPAIKTVSKYILYKHGTVSCGMLKLLKMVALFFTGRVMTKVRGTKIQ